MIKVLELIEKNKVTEDAAADILFRFGLEMEKLEKSDIAIKFYGDVREPGCSNRWDRGAEKL